MTVDRTSLVRSAQAKVALSTVSVYPEGVAAAFEIAGRLGYDGVEVMVMTDPVSQDPDELRRLSDHYSVPILAIHAPCLLVTQRVWSTDPWHKLERARAAAEALDADTVVVHPPFRWQRDYARDFVRGLARMGDVTDIRFAVENMYPWRARSRELAAYSPGWDVRDEDYPHTTLDLSHTAVSGSDALVMAQDLGDSLVHIHLADGSGSSRDEHLLMSSVTMLPPKGITAVWRTARAHRAPGLQRERRRGGDDPQGGQPGGTRSRSGGSPRLREAASRGRGAECPPGP